MSQAGANNNNGGVIPPASRFPITPYVVGPVGQAGYQTIQSAINAANTAGGGVVYIQPGSYTENLTLFSGVDLYGTPAVSQNQGATTTITGTHTPPSSGRVGFNSICFVSTTDVFSSVAAGTTHLVVVNCESAVQNGYFFNLLNWTGILEIFDFNPDTAGAPFAVNDGGINNTGGATVLIFDAGFGSGTNVMNLSGVTVCQGGSSECPINFQTGSNLTIDDWVFNGNVTLSNNSTGTFNTCRFNGVSSAAITMSSSASVEIGNSIFQSTNDPAISGSGAGILTLGDNSFLNNSNISSSLTTAGISEIINYVPITFGSSPYTVLSSDYYLGVNVTAGAVTIRLPNAPTKGRIFVIKDEVGLSSTNNITVTTVGGAVLIDGSTTKTINSNYGAMQLCFSGSVYEIYNISEITTEIASIAVNTTTGAGTNPVIPTAAGLVTFTGGQYATGTFGTRVLTINSTAANTLAVEAQISSAVASTLATKNGLSHFDSALFTVDANGFVSASTTGFLKTLTGDSGGARSPTANNINILGATAAAGTTPVTVAGAASTLTVTVQKSQAIAAADTTKIGLCNFNSAEFSVDSTGFVSLVAGGFTWTDVTGATQTLVAENGYGTDRGGGVTYTLPASGSFGDTIKILGKLGLSTIAQNANQQIVMGSGSSTVGVGGSIAGTNVGDCVELTCITPGASTVWRAANWVGNWTIT